MKTKPIPLTFVLPIILVLGIGALDYRLGFGFNLFPLYLVPVAIAAWKRSLREGVALALIAGIVIILKLFLTKHFYAYTFFWYWDAIVKFSLIVLFGFGLGRIRQLHQLQHRQNIARITELNASLQKQVENLTAANRELADVSYTISHDLRAPIRHIIGFVELLSAHNRNLDQKSRHYLRVISQSATKMGNLIDGLLAFSQLGRTELVLRRVDLDQTVRQMVDELAKQTGERALDWNIAPLPSVVGDPTLLQQVLFNLISNALKFTRPRRKATIEIGTVDDPEETIIFVRDNGIGFDMRYGNKLFGMFQRLHPGEGFEGTGIGLANVQRIVERHGGRAWAEGTVGVGATFWFSLPKRADLFPARSEGIVPNVRGRLTEGKSSLTTERHDDTRRDIA